MKQKAFAVLIAVTMAINLIPFAEATTVPPADIFDIDFSKQSLESVCENFGKASVTSFGSGTVGKVEVSHNGKTYVIDGYTKTNQGDYVSIDLTASGDTVHNALADGFTIETAFTLPASINSEAGILNGAGNSKGMGITFEKQAGKLDFCFHDGAYQYAFSNEGLTVGELYYVTGVYDNENATITLYINGELTSETSVHPYNGDGSACCWTMGKSPTGAACGINSFTVAKLYSSALTGSQVRASYENYISSLTESEAEDQPVDSGTGDMFDLSFSDDGVITSASNMFGEPIISGTGGTVGEVVVPHKGVYYATTGFNRSSSDFRVISLAENKEAVTEAIADGFTLEAAFTLPSSTGVESGILNGAVAGGGMGINYEKESGGGGGGSRSVSFTFHDGNYRYTNTPVLEEGELYVIACVYNAAEGKTRIYVNGEEAAALSVGGFNPGGFFATWFMGASPNASGDANAAKAFASANIFTMARLYSEPMAGPQVAESYEEYISSLRRMEDVNADIFDVSFNIDGSITSNIQNYGDVAISGTGGTVGEVVVPHKGVYYATTGFNRSSSDFRVISLAENKEAVTEAIADGFTLEAAFTLPSSTGVESGILNGAVAGGGMGINYEKESGGGGGGSRSVSFTFHDGNYRYTNTPVLEEGELYVIACVYNAAEGKTRIYVNGEEAAALSVGGFNPGGFFATWFMGASPNASGDANAAKAFASANIFTMARLYSEPMAGPQVAESYEEYISSLTECRPDSELDSAEIIDPVTGVLKLVFTQPVHIVDPAFVTLENLPATNIEYVDATIGPENQLYSTDLLVTFPGEISPGFSTLTIIDEKDAACDGNISTGIAVGLDDTCLKANALVDGVDAVTTTINRIIPATTTLEKAEMINDTVLRLTFSNPVKVLREDGFFVSNDFQESVLYPTPGNVVNVADYGAVPNDDKDDIYALQAAVDAVSNGGVVYFPAGTYMLSKALVFYSNQTLYFEPGATLKRGSADLTYLLANHTDGTEGGYDATENVNIIGCTFDGNVDINYKITMMNTGHCRNINLLNCTFRNGYQWHYFECNSTDTILIDGCVFEDSFDWNNNSGAEYLQFDAADSGAYGIIISVFGREDFKFDGTVCQNVTVRNCVFANATSRCVAVGNHNNKAHHTMSFYDNKFIGGMDYGNRGIINFTSNVYDLTFANNVFSDSPVGIAGNNTDYRIYESNVFTNVTQNWTGTVSFAEGVGPTTPAMNAQYIWATGAKPKNPEAVYSETILVTFESLQDIEGVAVLLGSVEDWNGNLVIPNTFSGTGYISSMMTISPTGGGSESSGASSGVASYLPVLDVSAGGFVVLNPRSPKEGDEVVVIVTPNAGYMVEEISVTGSNGNKVDVTIKLDGTYTFVQPRGRVTIRVAFARIDEYVAFADVPVDYWAYDEIAWAYKNGYINGTSETTFAPGASISRQQSWMILARLAGNYPANMEQARQWAIENGISDGTNPNNAITRQQLAAILYRFISMINYDSNKNGVSIQEFPDYGAVASYAMEPMAWAVSAGVLTGTTNGLLDPTGTATRAQFVVMLYRFWTDM